LNTASCLLELVAYLIGGQVGRLDEKCERIGESGSQLAVSGVGICSYLDLGLSPMTSAIGITSSPPRPKYHS
jgi:hypothetical protein